MDECRFDNWTRMLGAIKDRRTALREFAAAGLALTALARADLGFAQEGDVLVEGCRLSGERCDRGKQCCSGDCSSRRKKKKTGGRNSGGGGRRGRRRPQGECRCLGNGKNCRKDAACCKGRCDPGELRCRCVPSNERCIKDDDCCRGNCVTDNQGNSFCKGG
jgi:hypothetical protein